MPLEAGARLGPYEIISAIGAGGMGEVYRARDTKLNRDVALKILPDSFALDPDRLARFKREAQVLASLNHPNIAHIYGFHDSEPLPRPVLDTREGHGPSASGVGVGPHASYLVLELVEGPTLADRIRRGPLPVDEALVIARQVASALEAAHEQGIIHRDLKPANVTVRPDGVAKVLDFGLAKALDFDDVSSTAAATMTSPAVTGAGIILGTASYMAPEQARGKPVDKRADIWAFGCVLFEMLAGRPAFEGETVADVLGGVLHKTPDWGRLPDDLHPRIRLLLERCLERNPLDRYRDIGDARIDIEKVLADPERAWPKPIDRAAQSSAPAPLRWLAMTAGAVVVLGVIAATLLWNVRSKPAGGRVVRFSHVLGDQTIPWTAQHP